MDVYGKLLDVGDRVLILTEMPICPTHGVNCWTGCKRVKNTVSHTGVVFGVGTDGAYCVHLDGPKQRGWEGWGSATSVYIKGTFLMQYDHEWSMT